MNKYTTFIYSPPDGSMLIDKVEAENPDDAINAAIKQRGWEADECELEVLSVVQGHCEFEQVSPHWNLFPEM